jgi:hypothetical protein
MIDVLMAAGLLSALVIVIASLLAVSARSELASSTSSYANVLASNMASQASANGCGAATGYGPGSGGSSYGSGTSSGPTNATQLYQDCGFGTTGTGGGPNVYAIGDIAGPGTARCPSQSTVLPGPACYTVAGMSMTWTAGLSFSWGWSTGGPDLASITGGQAVQSPPDEVITTSTVSWRTGSSYQDVSHTVISPPPNVLVTGWQAGGLGAVLVDAGASSSTPVGLVVPGWPSQAPGPVVTSHNGYAVFPYVPAGAGYRVWDGVKSHLSAPVTVNGGQWSVVPLAVKS